MSRSPLRFLAPAPLRFLAPAPLRFVTPALLALTAACADIDPPVTKPIVPEGYAQTYVEVRSCRPSVEHDLAHVIVKTAPEWRDLYNRGPYPLPVGAVIVKEEYGYGDPTCTSLVARTVMRKEKSGYDSANGDWHWQRVETDGRVTQDGKVARCAACHTGCKARDFVCAD